MLSSKKQQKIKNNNLIFIYLRDYSAAHMQLQMHARAKERNETKTWTQTIDKTK
jgi:hypothetical protein